MPSTRRRTRVTTALRAVSTRRVNTFAMALVLGLLLASAALLSSPDSAEAQVAPSGVSCNASGGSGGFAPGQHEVTIGGRQVLVYVGSGYSPSRPSVLSFYLHGDGAGDRTFMSQARRQLLDDNGWVYVAPRANGDSWYATGVSGAASGNVGIETNAQLLEDVFEALFDDYNLCKNVLLGSSASGGSWFYDAYFLPTRGDQYPAYMNVGCGSSGIDDGWTSFPFYSNLLTFNTDQDILDRTKLHYSIGTADFLFAGAQEAIPHLQSLGFDVTTDFRTGVGHCAYDVDETAVNWWTELCSTGFVPVTSMDASGSVRPESCNSGQLTGLSCAGLAVTVDLNSGQRPTTGDDVILGTPGNDVVDAGAGDDTVCAEGGDDIVLGGDGADRLFGGQGGDILRGGPGADAIFGEGGADRLLGGIDGDTINGGDGDDYIGGFGGADTIDGGAGSDRIFGGYGADVIRGGDGADTINGLIGNDTIDGEGGADTINGDAGNDTVRGGSGSDVVNGGNAADAVFGDDGDDTLGGGKADDVLDGGGGSDVCAGNKHVNGDSVVRCETVFGVP